VTSNAGNTEAHPVFAIDSSILPLGFSSLRARRLLPNTIGMYQADEAVKESPLVLVENFYETLPGWHHLIRE
jgi:hypothetical protein